MAIVNIFPTPIAYDDWSSSFFDNQLDWIYKQESEMGTSHMISKNHNVLDDPILDNLRTWIDDKIKRYYTVLLSCEDTPYITQSWINFLDKGMYTHQHSHYNSVVSGVFYISANDSLNFYKCSSGIKINTTKNNFYNSEAYNLKVKSNRLVLFPSTLQHSTPTVDDKRISIAFNTFVKGDLGKDSQLTYLEMSND